MDIPKQRRFLEDVEAIKRLADRLAECPAVTRLDTANEREAWTLAHALADLEESFRRFLDEQLPKLMVEEPDQSLTYDLLLDIGEEFRHILYHMKDPRFYRYLNSAVDERE